MIDIQDLNVNDECWTGDGYGYDRIRILKSLHNHPDYPFPVVYVEDIDTGDKVHLGGAPNSPYIPSFYPKDW